MEGPTTETDVNVALMASLGESSDYSCLHCDLLLSTASMQKTRRLLTIVESSVHPNFAFTIEPSAQIKRYAAQDR